MNRFALTSLILLFCINVFSQNLVGFDEENWVFGENARTGTFMGKEVLQGMAYLKGVEIENGTIEVDVYSTGERNFCGFMFRLQSFEEYEWCWLRIHKTNGFIQDGVQYAPILNGTSCWQLFGGKNGIAPVNLPKNEWVHLKLDIQNDTASLFVTDMSKPVLIMDNLQLESKSGSVGLKGLWHDGLYFANFSYQKRERGTNHNSIKPEFEKNVIKDWKLSPRYQVSKITEIRNYPDEKMSNVQDWITPIVSSNGLINITRYYGHKPGRIKSCAILKTNLKSETNKQASFSFGYSDAVTIFVNRKPVFSGNNAYRSRNLAFGGWINYNDVVYFDLQEGDNELLVVVAEHFGGWGFQAKMEEVKD